MSKINITLAIESAVGGGSLSLFENSSIIDRWFGESDVSRSEELLTAIDKLLKRNQLRIKDLARLAVSLGPGSYTGARIGLATASGLKNGLNIECFGTSIFDALFHSLGNIKCNVVAAIPFGKNEICFQFYKREFNKNENETSSVDPKVLPFEEFVQLITVDSDLLLITNQKLYLKLEKLFGKETVINAGVYLADHIGRLTLNKLGSDNINAIYIHSLVNKG